MIVTSRQELLTHYASLKRGDICLGLISSGQTSQSLLVDLQTRGIIVLPSPLSQVLSGSKTAQARILGKWMLPDTLVIERRLDLLAAISTYNERQIEVVVTKENHLHCGYGIRRWQHIETLYNVTSGGDSKSVYPFVLQPYIDDFTDVRVIIAGDYIEAYTRKNRNNFRMNLSAGGTSSPYNLSSPEIDLCRAIMERGQFPYAHIDLMITPNRTIFLSEISLNAGSKAATISQTELVKIKKDILDAEVKTLLIDSGNNSC